jgi:hypothetical protein
MVKFIFYILSFIIGAMIYLFALGGAHGVPLFRMANKEDVIILSLLCIFFGVPLIFIIRDLIRSFKKRQNNKAHN